MKTIPVLQQRIRIFLAGKKYQDLWRYALTALAASLLTAGIMSSCYREVSSPAPAVENDASPAVPPTKDATAGIPLSGPEPAPAVPAAPALPADPGNSEQGQAGTTILLGNNAGLLQKTLRKGDSLGRILRPWGSSEGVRAYVQAANTVFPLKKLRIGQTYEVEYDVATRQLKRFTYTIDDTRRLIVEGEPPVARIVTPNGEEKSSLPAAATASGAPAGTPAATAPSLPGTTAAGAPTTPPPAGQAPETGLFQGTVRKGDTLIRMLRPWGKIQTARAYAHAANGVFPLNTLRIGQAYTVEYDTATRQIKRLIYTIDDTRRLIVEGQPPVARINTLGTDAEKAAPAATPPAAPVPAGQAPAPQAAPPAKEAAPQAQEK